MRNGKVLLRKVATIKGKIRKGGMMGDKIMRLGMAALLLIFFGVSLPACVTLPKEAPELSMQLGNRISSIEEAHFTLLHKYFNDKRSKVDEFIMQEWVPEFTRQVTSDPNIERVWAEIVRTGNKNDQQEFLVRLSPKLQLKINSKRLELIKPLDDAERLLERALHEEYQQARAINNSLTSFLVSAAKVDESRRRYMEMAGVTDQKMSMVIDKIDSGVGTLLNTSQNVADKEENTRKYLDQIKSVIETVKK